MKKKIFLKCFHAWLAHLFIALLFSTMINAQNPQQPNASGFEVKGTVRDNNGPLAGSTVSERGTKNSTLTNEDGSFSLKVSGSGAVLVFSFVGYKPTEVEIAGRSELNNIVLEPVAGELSNVVVTALGITRSKRSLAYSVAEVKSEDLVKA